MRGEHLVALASDFAALGSSPHARGALDKHAAQLPGEGIIPACAGSTIKRGKHKGQRGDHPRMRGEHRYHQLLPRHLPGSSPHARGAQTRTRLSVRFTRIIPACAGSTLAALKMPQPARDHPRMRGEH